MGKCFISSYCLLEESVSKVSFEFVNGVEHKRSSALIHSFLGNVEVMIHYLPFHPVIEISLKCGHEFGLVLYSGKFEYRSGYDSFLDYLFGEEDIGA